MSDPVLDEQGRPGRWILVDEPRPVHLAPIPDIPEMDGFRFARVFDEPTADGKPFIDPARERVTDPDERRRILDFLASGTVIFNAGSYSLDLLEPRRVGAVPTVDRTDGTWIWSDAVTYYLRWHQVPPEPELLAHIRATGYRAATVSENVEAAAAEARKKVARILHAAIDDWLVQTGRLADPSRFPIPFQERLLALGWRPGRDVSERVDEWLAEQLPTVGWAHFDLPGEPAYQPSDAALRVLREFGGLASYDNTRGITSARIPFRLMPGRTLDARSLRFMVGDAIDYGQQLGQPVFQIGVIEDGTAILVVAEDGSVHLAGSVQRYVGANFDETLRGMLDGELPEEPDDDDDVDAGYDWDPAEVKKWL
jgi:SUKH-3 immunity protein